MPTAGVVCCSLNSVDFKLVGFSSKVSCCEVEGPEFLHSLDSFSPASGQSDALKFTSCLCSLTESNSSIKGTITD